MSAESDNTSDFGVRSSLGWPVVGAIGGAAGAGALGLILWLIQPEAIEAAIPAAYGFDPSSVLGWAIHLGQGAVLGIIFGFIVTRSVILGVLRTDVETDPLSGTSDTTRVAAAGVVYGLAIWSILPALILPALTDAIGGQAAGEFPAVALESLAGHILFGIVLGLVFAMFVDLTDRSSGEPLEEND